MNLCRWIFISVTIEILQESTWWVLLQFIEYSENVCWSLELDSWHFYQAEAQTVQLTTLFIELLFNFEHKNTYAQLVLIEFKLFNLFSPIWYWVSLMNKQYLTEYWYRGYTKVLNHQFYLYNYSSVYSLIVNVIKICFFICFPARLQKQAVLVEHLCSV